MMSMKSANNELDKHYVHFVGIDIAKKSFVLATSLSPKTKNYDNTAQGIDQAICFIKDEQTQCDNGKTLVVLESTGGLEVPLAKALCLAGICVMIANPRQTHQFAKSQSLTKTDNKDAKMLAFYAKMMAQRDDLATLLYCPPSQSQELLTALINRRNQFVQMCTAEKNRLEQSHHSQVGSIQAHIAYLTEQIHELDKQIKTHLDDDNHPDLKQTSSVIQSIKGIGQTTTATLLAMLPELGTISHKQLASLVGVAPHPKQSGETKFKGLCQAGRPEVRKALYMATLVATRFDEKIKTFYQRLRANGKPFKVAIVACMHKLLTILNARVRDELTANTNLVVAN